ncbi:hypothetical protein Tco_1282700 [Tanacetum coccineum]
MNVTPPDAYSDETLFGGVTVEPKVNENQDEGFVGPGNQDVVNVVDDDSTLQSADPSVAERVVQRISITTAFEESSSKRKQVAVVVGSSCKLEAKNRKHEAPKRRSSRGSVPPLGTSGSVPRGVGKNLRVVRRLDGLSFDQLAKFDSVQALHLAMYGNMLTNEARFIADDLLKARKNHDLEGSQLVKDLKSCGTRMSQELDLLREVSRCRGFEEKKSTFLSTEASLRDEVETLSTNLESAHLERISLVKDSLPSAVKKLMASNHFSLAMADLEQKAMMFGMEYALNDVLGNWVTHGSLRTLRTMTPEVEKNYDEAGDAFCKLKFSYVTLLAKNANRSLDELAALEPPSLEQDVIQALPMPPS